MKKNYLSIVAFLGLASMVANADYLKESEIKPFNELPMIKQFNAKATSIYDTGDMYIANIKVQNATDTVFISKDKKYLIVGNVLNINNGKGLAAPIPNLEIAKDKESFVFGTGKKEYYLFTDPECPFCKKLEEYLPKLEKDVKIKVFYNPLLELHPAAKELSKYQLSLKEKNKNVLEIMSKTTSDTGYATRSYTPEESKKLDDKIDEQMKLAKTFNLNGTPAIVNDKGEPMNWVEFLAENGIKVER